MAPFKNIVWPSWIWSSAFLLSAPHLASAICHPYGAELDIKPGTSLDALATAVQEGTGCNLVFARELDAVPISQPLAGDDVEKITQTLAKLLHVKTIRSGPTFILAPENYRVAFPGTGRFVSVDFHKSSSDSVNLVLKELGVTGRLDSGGILDAKLLDVPQDDLLMLLRMRMKN